MLLKLLQVSGVFYWHRPLQGPSLQELSSHALETASCWVSGPHVSTPANGTDISVYAVALVGGSLPQVYSR